MSPNHRLGLLYVTGSAVAWSTAGLFTRVIHLDVWTMLAWRGLSGAAALLVLTLMLQGRPGLREFRHLGKAGWAFAIISGVSMTFFISSLRLTTVAHVAVIYATLPFLAAGLGFLVMREKSTQTAMLSSAMALAGVAIMVGLGAEGNLSGDLLALLMTLGMAVITVIVRYSPEFPVIQAGCVSALLCGLACIPFGHPFDVSAGDMGWLVAFGVMNSAVGLGLFTLGARLLPPIESALIGALDVPLAPLWVWLLFAETPSAATIAGGLIVFAAVAGHIVATSLTTAREVV